MYESAFSIVLSTFNLIVAEKTFSFNFFPFFCFVLNIFSSLREFLVSTYMQDIHIITQVKIILLLNKVEKVLNIVAITRKQVLFINKNFPQRNICTSVLPVCSSSQPAPCQRWATQFFTNTKVTNFLRCGNNSS